MNQDIIKQLQAPFPFDEVEAKIQVTNADKTKGMAVFYIDSRAIQKRLDEVVGMFNWKNQYYPWQNNSQLCGISVFDTEHGEWVEKQDGAPNTDIEPVMGGLSHSFKRAACSWSIGRYLYSMDGIWVAVEQKGKGSYIKDSEQSKLKAEYDMAVARIFGSVAPQSNKPANTPNKPVQPPQETQKSTAPSEPPVSNDSSSAPPVPEFQVKSIKPSGKASQVLELVDNHSGELLTAYVKASDESIAVGSRLRSVEMEQKTSSYGVYNLINNYQLVA